MGFEEYELVEKSARELDTRLRVSMVYFKVEEGEQARIIESKAHYAREHFCSISGDNVKYDVVDSYDRLWELEQG